MRPNRVLAVLLAALAVAGCARRAAPYQYATVPGPMVPAQMQAYQPAPGQAPVMQAPRYQPTVMQVPRNQVPANQVAAVQPLPVYQAPSVSELPYTLDSGDRLRISVFGQDGLTNSYAVDAAGNITMPLIGSVPARGLTPPQLSKSISERLRQGYIREPHVTLEIEAYRPFFILGEVTTPGQYPYVANMTAETAVAIAGGFGPRANKNEVSISRNQDGQVTQITVPLTYQLRPGDTVRVPERWF